MCREEHEDVTSIKRLLELLWDQINLPMQEHWIQNTIRNSARDANAPFADAGLALERILALGAARRDLSLVVRFATYDSFFTLLSLLAEASVGHTEIEMLIESLLTADPSGKDGGLGSAPQKA